MHTQTFDIEGPVLFKPRKFVDNRGYFMETFRQSIIDDAVKDTLNFVQDNQSFSVRKGTVRGLHFQSPPHAQGKLVRCSQGAIVDVAVDVRSGSSTFGQHVRVELTAEDGHQLWVPAGFLHGFSTLMDDVIVQYKCTDYYSSECDGTISWNDPDIGVDWGVDQENAIISEKDMTATRLRDFSTPFRNR